MTLFKEGAQFPPEADRERLAKYKRMRGIYKGNPADLYERATALLRDTPHAAQLRHLYIAVNLADILVTKPADLLVGEPPAFETGLPDSAPAQKAVTSYVEENDLIALIHESALSNGYRGDAWLKTRYDYRTDYSALKAIGAEMPEDARMEPIIEHVAADCVFPETSDGNVKKFKAVNIATVEYVSTSKADIPFLNVERHLPGYIVYEKYRLHEGEGQVDASYGVPIQYWIIGEKIATGRDNNVVVTEVPQILVQHVPYKSTDEAWQGEGGIEKLESKLAAINDRLAQIDYILWKHSDPNSYGPDLDTGGTSALRMGGVYIPTTKDDVVPGYMTWDGQLDGAFRQLETLISAVFLVAETPQWLFGSVIGGGNSGGTGTSHTDSGAIKARFLPILSKVNRIRTHYDRAIRDALYACQLLDVAHGDAKFTPVYPVIAWQDGIPHNEKEQAEIMQIRTGGKATIDVQSAVKRMDGVDDEKAAEIVSRIEADDEREVGTVDSSIFNEEPTEVTEPQGGEA